MAEVLEEDALLEDAEDVRHAGGDAGPVELNDDMIAQLLSSDVPSDKEKENEGKSDKSIGNVEMYDVGEDDNAPNGGDDIGDQIAQDLLLGDVVDDEGFEEAPEAVIEEEVEADDVGEILAIYNNGDIEERHMEVDQAAENALLISDNEANEDYDQKGETEQEDEEDGSSEGNTTRKRAGGKSSAPSHKRVRTDRPFFEGRRKVIEMFTKLYGSWEASLSASQVRSIGDLRKKQFDEIIEAYMKEEQSDKLRFSNLQQQLKKEQQSSSIYRKQVDELTAMIKNLRGQVGGVERMIIQPASVDQFLVGDMHSSNSQHHFIPTLQRHSSNMSSVSQQNTPRHYQVPVHYQQQQAQQQRYHSHQNPQPQGLMDQSARDALEKRRLSDRNHLLAQMQASSQLNGAAMIRGTVAGPVPAIGTNRVHHQMSARTPSVPCPRAPQLYGQVHVHNQPTTLQPKFQTIPRRNYSMGHKLQPAPQVQGDTQELIDLTKENDNTINLCVPFVPTGLVISSGDSSRLPMLPKMLSSIQKTPDVSITFHSTVEDFKDNWQICGKINYEYMGMREDKTIQVFVQVASLKAAGMHGRPNPSNKKDRLNWGISGSWPCKAKAHKFRIQFHVQQTLPVNDRITIIVVIRNTVTGGVEVSEPSFLNLV